ncbi:hypothetical protein Tco_0870831 [Tanacetum coccineum]
MVTLLNHDPNTQCDRLLREGLMGNAECHEIMTFFHEVHIHYALWYITATVAGKPVTISEASIRSDLLFDDADGIDTLNNQAIFDTIQLMGYEGDLTVLTFKNNKPYFTQWKFLFHTMNHCISSKSTSWDQIPTNIATAVICLATNQKYNFSKLIFDGMMRHLDAKKKFVMYPRFILVFLAKQLKNVPVPLDHFPINTLTSKVLSFMVKKGKKFSGNVTPLFDSMLVQPTEDGGEASERPSESHPDPLLLTQVKTNPSHSLTHLPDLLLLSLFLIPIQRVLVGIMEVTIQAKEIKDLKAHLKKFKKKARPGRKTAKSKPTAHKDQTFDVAFDDLDDLDAMDYMETEDAHNEKGVSTEDQVSTVNPDEGTDKPKVSTDQLNVSTDKLDEGTAEPKNGNSDENATPTATPTVFGDDETIAEFLVSMSQNKAKQKGVEIKDTKDTDRPRTTSKRSILTLKPLPKIDPKDKGKKVLEEEAESEAESEGVNEAERKFAQLANDEEIARKVQEEWETEEEKKKLAKEEATKAALIRDYDDIQARIEADSILSARL